jgi:hypothetical protein
MKSCVKPLHDMFPTWFLYKNTVSTEANTAATKANTAAMATEAAKEAGSTTTSKVSSMIQHAWKVVKKPLAYVGSAYAGYLIYVRQCLPCTHPI